MHFQHIMTVRLLIPLIYVCVLAISLWFKPGGGEFISSTPTGHRVNLPSGASLKALPDISRSPTSHT